MIDKQKAIKYMEDPNFALFESLNNLLDSLPDYRKLLVKILDNAINAKGEKGNDGDDGYTPIKGIDYFDGKDGKNGYTPIKGKDYFDGENEKDADIEKVISEILLKLPAPKDGKDGSPDDGEMIVKKLVSLKPDKRLPLEMIKGYEKIIYPKKGTLDMRWHGGGDVIQLYDLSSQLNGVLKTFTIPAHSKISLVTSSSAPFFFRPTIDYTDTKTSIIFNASIDASIMLAKGQSIGILYVATSV